MCLWHSPLPPPFSSYFWFWCMQINNNSKQKPLNLAYDDIFFIALLGWRVCSPPHGNCVRICMQIRSFFPRLICKFRSMLPAGKKETKCVEIKRTQPDKKINTKPLLKTHIEPNFDLIYYSFVKFMSMKLNPNWCCSFFFLLYFAFLCFFIYFSYVPMYVSHIAQNVRNRIVCLCLLIQWLFDCSLNVNLHTFKLKLKERERKKTSKFKWNEDIKIYTIFFGACAFFPYTDNQFICMTVFFLPINDAFSTRFFYSIFLSRSPPFCRLALYSIWNYN